MYNLQTALMISMNSALKRLTRMMIWIDLKPYETNMLRFELTEDEPNFNSSSGKRVVALSAVSRLGIEFLMQEKQIDKGCRQFCRN